MITTTTTTNIVNQQQQPQNASFSSPPPSSHFPHAGESNRYIMRAKLTSAKALSTILSTVLLKKTTRAKFQLLDSGIKVIVHHESKAFQCVAFLRKGLFQSYHFSSDAPVEFELQLADLIDCLNFYGGSASGTSVFLSFPGVERTLSLLLSEASNHVMTDCGLRTSEVDHDVVDYSFGSSDSSHVAMIKLDADVLKEAITEVEYLESSITMAFKKVPGQVNNDPTDQQQLQEDSNNEPVGMRLSSEGHQGIIDVLMLHNSPPVHMYTCTEDCSFRYLFQHFQRIGKALLGNQTTATIKVNQRGICSIQQHIRQETDDTINVVEYILAPELNTIDSEDGMDDYLE